MRIQKQNPPRWITAASHCPQQHRRVQHASSPHLCLSSDSPFPQQSELHSPQSHSPCLSSFSHAGPHGLYLQCRCVALSFLSVPRPCGFFCLFSWPQILLSDHLKMSGWRELCWIPFFACSNLSKAPTDPQNKPLYTAFRVLQDLLPADDQFPSNFSPFPYPC